MTLSAVSTLKNTCRRNDSIIVSRSVFVSVSPSISAPVSFPASSPVSSPVSPLVSLAPFSCEL